MMGQITKRLEPNLALGSAQPQGDLTITTLNLILNLPPLSKMRRPSAFA